MLVKLVFAEHEHFDVDQLLEKIDSRDGVNGASRPTVYRTLKELVDAGLLRRFELNGRSVYEHDYGYPPHDHMYCVRCKQLLEFRNEEIRQLSQKIAREQKFRIQSHRLILQGICASCSKRGQRSQDRV